VWLNGVKVKTVGLYSSAAQPRTVMFTKDWVTTDLHPL
jgi:hypothetical protein